MSGLSSYKGRQGPLGILLLESLGLLDNVQVSFNDKKISNLVNRKKEVDEAVVSASTNLDVINHVVNYFKDKVIPDLNPHTKDDMFQDLMKCINSDATTAPSKYDEFDNLLKHGDVTKCLAYTFLYAINRPNKINSLAPASDDFPLLDEVGNECPLCHSKLTQTVKGVIKRKYDIVRIFPEGLDADTANNFITAYTPAAKIDSIDNQIALCTDDAENYLTDPTLDEYVNLSELKKRCSSNYTLQQTLAKLDLENEITNVIDSLIAYHPSRELEPLNMTALKIADKILPEDFILKNNVQNNVLTYFNYIKLQFAEFEDFELLQADIKKAFKTLDNGDWTQTEIVEKLAYWILEKTKIAANHIEACRIIVSFFIQNCEVFYEIAK